MSRITVKGFENLGLGTIGKKFRIGIIATTATSKKGISRFAKALGQRV